MIASPITSISSIQKIAIIDDDKSEAEMAGWEVKEAGFEPLIINGQFLQLEDLSQVIHAEAQAALCDHRLGYFGFANFPGAKLVAHLYDLNIPAILITQYADIDKGVSIRNWRDKIPVLLSRDEADASTIMRGLEDCLNELHGQIPNTRKPYRVLLSVKEVGTESNLSVIDVIIPSWNPLRAVRFPASLIPPNLQKCIKPGARFIAQVNIGAEKSDDLYFKGFELAKGPGDDDGLA